LDEENSKTRKIDRVELVQETLERLQSWQKQIDDSCPEVMTTRKDLVNWVILEHKETLSDSDLRKIKECFFDPVQYLKSLLKKAEIARTQGQEIEIPDLLGVGSKPKKTKAANKIEAPEPTEAT
jgi:hypothetical protein